MAINLYAPTVHCPHCGNTAKARVSGKGLNWALTLLIPLLIALFTGAIGTIFAIALFLVMLVWSLLDTRRTCRECGHKHVARVAPESEAGAE